MGKFTAFSEQAIKQRDVVYQRFSSAKRRPRHNALVELALPILMSAFVPFAVVAACLLLAACSHSYIPAAQRVVPDGCAPGLSADAALSRYAGCQNGTQRWTDMTNVAGEPFVRFSCRHAGAEKALADLVEFARQTQPGVESRLPVLTTVKEIRLEVLFRVKDDGKTVTLDHTASVLIRPDGSAVSVKDDAMPTICRNAPPVWPAVASVAAPEERRQLVQFVIAAEEALEKAGELPPSEAR